MLLQLFFLCFFFFFFALLYPVSIHVTFCNVISNVLGKYFL